MHFLGETDEPADKASIKVNIDGNLGSDTEISSDESLRQWLRDPQVPPQVAYSIARESMTKMVVARVVMGGKMGLVNRPDDHYEGTYPGVLEEAVMALRSNQALVVLGAFGGAARDLAIALGLLDESQEVVPRGLQNPTYKDAITIAQGLANRLPEPLRTRLSQIARDDRADFLSYAIVQVFVKWLQGLPAQQASIGVHL